MTLLLPSPTDDLIGALDHASAEPVALVEWPADAGRRGALAAAGLARLLLVAEGAPAPRCGDPLEDWIRLPTDPIDLEARRSRLALRLAPPRPAPVLDDDGVLRCGQELTILPPVEARLAARLLADAGHVVGRDELRVVGWPEREPDDRALDGRIKLLRRRLEPLGLDLHTVRGVGFLLEA